MTTKQIYAYFYKSEAEQFTFYRIPKILFTDKRFANVSIEAKVLYGLLLDRMSLSIKNAWIDEGSRVYIYFRLEEAMEYMNIGKDKGVKLFAELDDEKGCGLISRKKQGLGKPTMIYVMNFNTAFNADGENTSHDAEVWTSEKPKSRRSEVPKPGLLENRSLDFCNSEVNNTKYNNTEFSNTEGSDTYPILSHPTVPPKVRDRMEERDEITAILSQNLECEILKELYDPALVEDILHLMVDTVCSSRCSITIGCEDLPKEVVSTVFLKLGRMHIEYVLDALQKHTGKVRNIKSYLLAMLYNSYSSMRAYYITEVNHDLYGGSEQ